MQERKGKRKFKSVKDRNNTQSKWERRSKSVKERKCEGKRLSSKEKKSLCNKEMDTWVSSGWQRHVTHYRQRLEKSLVFLLQSHHMKTNTALVRHRTARHELRSTNTWGRNSWGSQSGTGKRDISASAIPRERCSQHRHIFASCFTELTERAAAKGWKGLQHTSCCCIRDRKHTAGGWPASSGSNVCSDRQSSAAGTHHLHWVNTTKSSKQSRQWPHIL